jgi:hypothetical protein
VVLAKVRGGFAAKPRWADAPRSGGLSVEFSRLLGPEELESLDTAQVQDRLAGALAHDELDWLVRSGRRYASPRSAERLELALFLCPACGAVAELGSRGRIFACRACGAAQELDGFYRFRPHRGSVPSFADIRDWESWQTARVGPRLAELAAAGGPGPLFSDRGARLYRGYRTRPLTLVARGRLEFHADRLELLADRGTRLVFHLADIDGSGTLLRKILEFYVGQHLYRITFRAPDVSARKWQLFMEAAQARLRASQASAVPATVPPAKEAAP